MRKLSLVSIGVLVSALLVSPQAANAVSPNLVANPSVETGTPPTSWAQAGWGTNTHVLSTPANGADGVRSLQVNVTAYTNGAAEWLSAATPVTAGSKYTFHDSYKSTAETEIGAVTNSGAYLYLATLPAAGTTAWAVSDVSFTVPAGVTNLQLLHTIYSVGSLQTDAYYLGLFETPPPPAVGDELVKNPGAETANGSAPASWTTNSWSTSTAMKSVFAWDTVAHTGTKSLKVTVTGRPIGANLGDAKWLYDVVPVTAGKYYTFSDWYKSNSDSAVSLYYENAAGVGSWANLTQAIAPSPTVFTEYKSGIIMPDGAVRAFFAHFLPTNGYLNIDDVSMKMAAAPAGFNRAIISLTFDDGSPSIYSQIPKMDALGFKSTQYVPTAAMGTDVWSAAQVKNVSDRGHEIGCHTVNHPDLTTVNAATLKKELVDSKKTLDNIIKPKTCVSFATPYGSYNTAVINAIKAAGYTNHRSVDVGFNTKNDLDQWNVHVQNILWTTTPAQVKKWVTDAVAGKYYLVLVYHEIVTVQDPEDPDGSAYFTTPNNFSANLADIKASGITVLPINAALAELLPQVTH